MPKQIDFLALGDITIDAFINLSKDYAHIVHGERGKEEICMSFGDKIPYESVEVVYAVGNSPNAAVAAARLGLVSALVSNLGADRNGEACIAVLKENGVITDYIERHEGLKTNYHYVLRYEEERTILIKHEEYPYALPEFPEPRWLYLSSLGEKSLQHHQDIANYLRSHSEVKLAFQPGTFQIKMGHEQLKDLFELSTLFFCNKQEAQRITGLPEELDIKKLLASMRALGPKIVMITDGPHGAYVDDGAEAWFMPMYPDPAPPVSRTGAGDAFAATFSASLALGQSIPVALTWAPIDSMSVVQQVGAQKGLLTREKLEEYLATAPPSYKPEKI